MSKDCLDGNRDVLCGRRNAKSFMNPSPYDWWGNWGSWFPKSHRASRDSEPRACAGHSMDDRITRQKLLDSFYPGENLGPSFIFVHGSPYSGLTSPSKHIVRVCGKKYCELFLTWRKKNGVVLFLILPWGFHWFFFIGFLPWCQKFEVFFLVFSLPGDDLDIDTGFNPIGWVFPGLLIGAVNKVPKIHIKDNCLILSCQGGENHSLSLGTELQVPKIVLIPSTFLLSLVSFRKLGNQYGSPLRVTAMRRWWL